MENDMIKSNLNIGSLGILQYVDNKKEDDKYLYFKNRALSQVLLEGQLYIDTRREGVLQDAAPLLVDKLVLANHKADVSQWVGKVVKSMWSDSDEVKGIDTIIRTPKPDSEFSTPYNSGIVKGLLSGDLNSFSVGVRWQIEKSHNLMEITEFLLNQGKEIDGEIVRFIVKKITGFDEISIVHQGRDPNAKLIDKVVLEKDSLGLESDLSIDSNSDMKQIVDTLFKSSPKKNFYIPENNITLDINLNIKVNEED
jgi:hypothetical protein